MKDRIVIYQRLAETKKYKRLFQVIFTIFLPVVIPLFIISRIGDLADFIGEHLAKIINWIIDNLCILFKWDGAEIVEDEKE